MGDIADDLLEGSFCSSCGEYLGEGYGFPRTCTDCGGEWEPEELDEVGEEEMS